MRDGNEREKRIPSLPDILESGQEAVSEEAYEEVDPISSFEDFYNNSTTIPPEIGQKIEDTIRTAADIRSGHGLWTPRSHIQIASVPSNDLELVEFRPYDTGVDEPWVFITDSEEEYNAALAAAGYVTRTDPRSLAGLAKHEKEHLDALKQIDVDAETVLGIGFTATQVDEEDFEIGIHPFMAPSSARVTKIGYASMLAYPSEPSPGDIIQVQEMGYSMEGLMDRIDGYNNRGLEQLPLPERYRS